jgi:hypothetical protein
MYKSAMKSSAKPAKGGCAKCAFGRKPCTCEKAAPKKPVKK